jgi:hypothetical protein
MNSLVARGCFVLIAGNQPDLISGGDRLAEKQGDRSPKNTPPISMPYAENIAFMNLMRLYLEPLSLEISPDSLNQGEPAIRQVVRLL